MKKVQISLLIIFLVSSTLVFAQENATQKPNVLWITIEDTSPQFIGAYGNLDARTPNIDKLAKEGTRFTNAFSTASVCSPSRSTIITGIKTYKLGTGHHRSKISIPDFVKGFPFYLREIGYLTTNNSKTDYNLSSMQEFVSTAWNESSANAGWWQRKAGQPFFSVFNFMQSHQSKTMTAPFATYKKQILAHLKPEEIIGDNDFKMPPIYRDSPEMRKQFARVYNSIKYTDNKIGQLLERLEKDNLKDSTIIFFYADHGEGMPRGKTNGIDYGYRVPFVVWFPPMYKHLSPWGKSGLVTDELIDFEDLAPTMLSLAGAKVPDYLTGRILIGKNRSQPVKQIYLSSDRADNGPDLVRTITNGRFVYSRNFMPFQPELRFIRYMEIGAIKQEMRKDFKAGKLNKFQSSLFGPRQPESLYDIKNDLWETRNLALEPAYKDMLKNFRKDLEANIIAEKDILLLPEYKTRSISKNTTLYEFRKDSKNYPVNEVYAVASLSGFRGLEVAKKQVAFLKNKNEDVRYWAILGLHAQDAELQKKYEVEILKALQDDYPPVAITAAAIAYDGFENKNAESFLQKAVAEDNPDLALMAINYLLYVKNPKPFITIINNMQGNNKLNINVKDARDEFLGMLGLLKPESETVVE